MHVAERLRPIRVSSVLKARGVPVAELEAIRAALADLPDEQIEELRENVDAIARGGERAEQLTRAADWMRSVRAAAAFQERSAPPAQQRAAAASVEDDREDEAPEPAAARVSPQRQRSAARPPRHDNRLMWPHHVYGTKAAMCVEVVEVEREEDRHEFSTLQLEFAAADGKNFGWADKQVFRLGRRELPVFAAVLLGFAGSLTFSGHGPSHDKELHVVDQGAHLFVKFRKGRKTLALQLTAGDVMDCATRAMHVLMANAPGIDSHTLALMCRRAGQLHATAAEVGSNAG